MPALRITLPQEVYRVAHKRASSLGYKTVAEYVTAMILTEAGGPVPDELKIKLLDTPAMIARTASAGSRIEADPERGEMA
ncbi:MAG TPA: hypothetical protein VG326_13395 [Tepidisphaeraceae bacterium]|jgi:hypothetical protein|nr:hypothetical protein [Tepidisphaeraceae bacterium]